MLPYETSLPLRIELRPSRWLRLLLLALAGGALLALSRSMLPSPALLIVPVLLLLSWPRDRWRGDVLVLRADGSSIISDAAAQERPVQVQHVDARGPLMLLAWRDGERSERLALLPDTLDAASCRLLRLWAERHVGAGGDHRSIARV